MFSFLFFVASIKTRLFITIYYYLPGNYGQYLIQHILLEQLVNKIDQSCDYRIDKILYANSQQRTL